MKKQRYQTSQQLAVPTPLWLQKRMLHNLEKAAKNKVSPSRAECAQKVLRAVGNKRKPGYPHRPLIT